MALGKIRSTRRPPSSSSSSYKSTITTLVFVALCVVGLWMLTSSSFVTTSSSSSTTSRITRSFTSNAPPLVKPIRGDDESHHAVDPFEDNPGELPDDALKRGHHTSNSDEVDKTNLLERSRDPETTAAVEQETGNENGESSMVKNEEEDSGSHNQQQEEHDNQATTEERNQDQLNDQTQQQSDAQHEMEPQHTQESEAQNTQESEPQNTQESEAQNTQENEAQNTQENEAQNTQESEAQNTQESGGQTGQEIKQETEIETHENLQQENTLTPEVEQKTGQTQESSGEQTQAHESEQPTEVSQQPGIPKESTESKEAWSTQADQSENQKERKTDNWSMKEYTWELCNVSAGADYIPCLDNEEALKKIHNTGHYEHRERHCPEEGPTCLVPLPNGYKRSIEWPSSRDKIWYHNVPHTKLAEVKGHQNWVKVTGEFLTFPGGGTQFIHGALHYIDFLQKSQANIAWGKHTRTVLDVGCGVASFGGFLFERDVLTMSFAPKDEHEAQVQFALERGIPAISAVMGTQRLPFPGIVFDLVHCARCRVPWHKEGGTLLLELNRVLRPGGYFVWSATPVYQKLAEDVEIWKEMKSLTASMCWELVTIQKDKLNSVGAAIYRKPTTNDCYNKRKHNKPPMCKDDNDPNAAWSVPLQSCLHKVPVEESQRGSRWPDNWPARVHKAPYWLNNAQKGIYGKPAPDDFVADHEHWRQVVTKTYMSGLQISWSNVRNVMDMRAVYGGFAAALKDLKVWVMNVVGVDGPDTLPIIYERGMFGIYHDWCESFSTYPRTYDLLHADHLFSSLKQRCKLLPVIVEVDRIARPGGKLIVRDDPNTISEIENILKSLQWVIHLTSSNDGEGILSAEKSDWRPETKLSSS